MGYRLERYKSGHFKQDSTTATSKPRASAIPGAARQRAAGLLGMALGAVLLLAASGGNPFALPGPQTAQAAETIEPSQGQDPAFTPSPAPTPA